jgi:Transposase IS200 like
MEFAFSKSVSIRGANVVHNINALHLISSHTPIARSRHIPLASGYNKGKSAIHVARVYGERKQNSVGQHFWARGYMVSTVGRDETVIREYIRNHEEEDKRLDTYMTSASCTYRRSPDRSPEFRSARDELAALAPHGSPASRFQTGRWAINSDYFRGQFCRCGTRILRQPI